MSDSPFVGREDELGTLTKAIPGDDSASLIPVVGATGIGKCALLNRGTESGSWSLAGAFDVVDGEHQDAFYELAVPCLRSNGRALFGSVTERFLRVTERPVVASRENAEDATT